MIRKGLLGELHHIRAQWHRGNLPGNDSWQQPMPKEAKPDDPQADELDKNCRMAEDSWRQLKQEQQQAAADWEKKVGPDPEPKSTTVVDAKKFGYEDLEIKDAAGKVLYSRPAIEELIRWRLWDRTGAGLMAELGSHQLDAASIFIAAAHGGEKQHPLSVAAAAIGRCSRADRDCRGPRVCIFEFPAPGYDPKDPIARQKKIGVQYASINGNGFGGYGETVFGTEGTLVLETEKDAMLFKTHETDEQDEGRASEGKDGKRRSPR